jgi:HEAT repeat protein
MPLTEKEFTEIIQANNEARITASLQKAQEEGTLVLLKPMIVLMKHENKNIARQALISSASLIKTQLVASWGSIEKSVKDSLAALLKKLNPAVVEHISKDLYSENEEKRLRVLQVLGLMGQDEKIKQVVSKMLTDPDERMRATAISLLKNMALDKDITLIYRVLHDPDPRVRANCVETLESINNPNVVGTLLPMRTDKNNRVRGNVLKALFNLGHRNIIGDIKAMLEDDNRLMRATAGWVLGEVGQSGDDIFMTIIGEYGLDRDQLARINMIKACIKINNLIAQACCKHMFEPDEVNKAAAELERMRKFRGK